MPQTDLIKTVRGLDQTGPGDNGHNLQLLWAGLAAAADSPFHAAEESSLRWLLKSMNGASPPAELLRRYPLTWAILDCVFGRIPHYSLAKSLADRKFMAVLQQTLKDIARPAAAPPASPKRKRAQTALFDLGHLSAPQGCLDTAQALFLTLRHLLERLETTGETFSRDRIGAEHIKSLFGTSAAEATAVAAPALTVCGNLLASGAARELDGAEDWIRTISRIWDLHLQGYDDSLEVANHLFRPSAIILGRAGAFSTAHAVETSASLRARWVADIQTLMLRSLVLPGRAAFINQKSFESFTTALELSKDVINLSGPALYWLSSTASSGATEAEGRKSSAEWMQRVFQAVERAIRERPDRSALMQTILEQATRQAASVAVDDLRRVCRVYGLQGPGTDWALVSKAAMCDPDVFQLSDEGVALRNEICDLTMTELEGGIDQQVVMNVINAIMDGFRTRRDFSSFMRLWFERLCEAERSGLDASSPWFQVARQGIWKGPRASLIETEMSPIQLGELIAWVEAQDAKSHPRSACVFTSAVTQAVRSEAFVDAVGRRLFDVVWPIKSSRATAPKWRVVSSTMSWLAPDERSTIWSTVEPRLSKVLKKSSVESAETFEAFKCCCQAWDSMSPDGALMDEPASLVVEFAARLARETSGADAEQGAMSGVDQDSTELLQYSSAYQPYFAWYLYGSSRFAKLYAGKKGELPEFLLGAMAARTAAAEGPQSIWNALVQNDTNINDTKLARDLVDRLISALEASDKEKFWPGEEAQTWIKTVTSIPLDVYNRAERERLMSVLSSRRPKMVKHPNKVSLDAWRLVLGLATKMVGRPTFYEGMSFTHLVELAETLPGISVDNSVGTEAMLELVECFSLMACATVKQMAENIDERSLAYFETASAYVAGCESQASAHREVGRGGKPLSMTLLKALATELERSPNRQGHDQLGALVDKSRSVLARSVMGVMGALASDKKLLKSSDAAADMCLYATIDAAGAAGDLAGRADGKASSIRKLEKRSRDAMQRGDLRGWKTQAFLRTYLSADVEDSRPTRFDSLDKLPLQLREPLLRELVASVTGRMSGPGRLEYLKEMVDALRQGCNTDGQVLAIQAVVDQLIGSADFGSEAGGFSLAAAHSQLTTHLAKAPSNTGRICRVLHTLLEKRPQAMKQWNIELTLGTVCDLASTNGSGAAHVSSAWLCKLVEAVIKKHRLRLEGHYHLLLTTLQALLRALVVKGPGSGGGGASPSASQEASAHSFARLVTLVCEPTAGAVSRSQLHSALDSATDAAKRTAGRHMHAVLMQYVKLQLEETVAQAVREALEPAIFSIFGVVPPEGRKILNDAMDGSGRAILRDMYKRYTRFGKWSGA